MVGNMHDETMNRLEEEEALDRAMTSIDPILQASLQREQHRRRRRFVWGGIAMVTLLGILALMVAMPAPQEGTSSENAAATGSSETTTSIDETIANAEKASELGRRGWQQSRRGDVSQAADLFAEAVQLDAEDESLWNGWGWALMRQQKFQEAHERFRQCLELNSEHGGALNGAGQAMLFSGDYEKAKSYFQQAGEDAPAALFGLARVQLLTGAYDQAKQTLNQLAKSELGELDRELLEQMFEAAKSKKLPPGLRKELAPAQVAQQSSQSSGSDADANQLNAKGWQLFNQGQARGAEIAFKKSLAINPDHTGAQNGLGFALLNQGKHKEARPIFAQLVKTNKQHPGFVNGLARCYEQAGDREEAVRLWKTVDSPDGQVTACTWGIARTLTDLGEFTEALKYWQRIKSAAPQDPTVQQMIDRCEKGA